MYQTIARQLVAPEILTMLGVLLSILFGTNIFFIKKLVEKIELAAESAGFAKNQLNGINQNVSNVANQLREIKNDIKDLRRVEIEVAVLKDRLNVRGEGDA